MTNKKIYNEKVYGRKKGRPLGVTRSSAVKKHFIQFQIKEDLLLQSHSLDPHSLFTTPYSGFWLEIGFGQGEHLHGRLKQNPDIGYLGAEIFSNGVAGLLKAIDNDPANNIRFFQNDGMILSCSLKPQSLDGIYILNPDPWHKKRHHKRRIINLKNLDIFAKILKPGGQFILSTDVPYLAEWMLMHTIRHPAFVWTATCAADWQTPPQDWITTRYEQKRAKGAHKMAYLIFERKPLQS